MGLDNGVVFRTKTPVKIPKWAGGRGFLQHDHGGEVCYWRRCYGLRADILNALNALSGCEKKSDYYLTADDVHVIRKVLVRYFLYPRRWRKSIWKWRNTWPQQLRHIFSLSWLERYMLRHPDNIEWVIFYDSY